MRLMFALFLSCLLFSPAHAALRVLACEPEWAALIEELAGDRAEVTVATSPTQDPHQVQARPSLISAARRADLAVCTGADLEVGWLPVLLNKGANPKIRTEPGLFLAAEHVSLLDVRESVSRSEGDVHAAGNPHFHLDPRRMLQVAQALAARLTELDPNGAADYQANRERLERDWTALLEQLANSAINLEGLQVVVHHANFRYLLDWLNMETMASLEPRPGVPPSPGHLSSLVDQVDNSEARLILYTDYNGDRAARWLAEQSGLCAVKLPFTVGAVDNTESLGALYRYLVASLVTATEQCPSE